MTTPVETMRCTMRLLESTELPRRVDLELARLSRALRQGKVKVPSWMDQATIHDVRGRVIISYTCYPNLPQHGVKDARFRMALEPDGPDKVRVDEIYAFVSFKHDATMLRIPGRTSKSQAAKEIETEWNSIRYQLEDSLGIGSLRIDPSDPPIEGHNLFPDLELKDIERILEPFASILFDARGWEWLRQHAGK